MKKRAESQEWREIDPEDQDLNRINSFAHRIAELQRKARKQDEALQAWLDDLVGALYALVYAKEKGFVNRSGPIETAPPMKRAEELAKGKIRNDGRWIAGFHMNSACYRISALHDRALSLVSGLSDSKKDDRRKKKTQELYRTWKSREWNTDNVSKVLGYVVDLKHRIGGSFSSRKAKYANAVEAIDELLNLVETWRNAP